MTRMTRRRWLLDAGLALLVALLGLVEVWLPMDSVMGDGSPVVSTAGILWFAVHLAHRRGRPWVALGGLLVWPVLGILQGGHLQVLFFGQLVPAMVLVYSLARFATGTLRWVAPVCGILFVSVADLFMPLLQDPGELVFHWAAVTLSFLVGHALRVSEDRASREAVRAHQAEAEARERAITAVAQERSRIARELHDIVAHSVGMIVVQAGAAEQVVEDDPAFARKALETIRSTGSSALAEMRRLVEVLRDPVAGADFAPTPGLGSLDELVQRAKDAGLDVRLEVSGARPDLPTGVDLAAYRIVQQALTNVRDHSQAKAADVSLDVGPRALRIEVSDAGPARDGTGPPGHGLLGMRERAALYGGHVEAGREGEGFVVRAELPLEQV